MSSLVVSFHNHCEIPGLTDVGKINFLEAEVWGDNIHNCGFPMFRLRFPAQINCLSVSLVLDYWALLSYAIYLNVCFLFHRFPLCLWNIRFYSMFTKVVLLSLMFENLPIYYNVFKSPFNEFYFCMVRETIIYNWSFSKICWWIP